MWVEIIGKWVARHAHAEPEGVGIKSRDQHFRALNQFIGEGHVIYIPDSSKTHLQIEIFTILRTLKNEFTGACGSYRLTTCTERAVPTGGGPFILPEGIGDWRKQRLKRSTASHPIIVMAAISMADRKSGAGGNVPK
jgi:hypothetical protein